MAYVARLPEKSWWSRQLPDSWLLVGFVLTLLLAVSGQAVRLELKVASLDHEVGQIYPMQHDIVKMKDDARADRILTASRFEDVGKAIKNLQPPVVKMEEVR